jgi:cytochrome c
MSTSAPAQDRAAVDEAQAMAEAAAAFLEAEGPETAFAAFTADEAWRDRDLYVFVFDLDGISVAHGGDPTLVGQDLTALTDVNGFMFVQAFLAIESTGWVDYVWLNPLTGVEEPKTSYIVRGGDYILGVGAYVIGE